MSSMLNLGLVRHSRPLSRLAAVRRLDNTALWFILAQQWVALSGIKPAGSYRLTFSLDAALRGRLRLDLTHRLPG